MRDNPDGTRTVWEPATGLWDRAEAVTGDDAPPTPRTTNRGTPKRAAGAVVVTRIKIAGGTIERPVTLARLCEITGQNPGAMRKQLEAAVTNGFADGDESRGWWPV